MEQLKSNMPAFEEVKAEYTMRMVQIRLSSLPSTLQELHIDCITSSSQFPVKAYVYEIADPKLSGFPLAKVWEVKNDIIALVYATEAVTPENRPFGKGKTYIAVFSVMVDDIIEYNVDMRASIQQIVDNNDTGSVYVVSFGESEYDVVVKKSQQENCNDNVH